MLSSLSTLGSSLLGLAVLDFGLQWFLYLISAALQTEKFFDLAGSSTFILLAYLSVNANPEPTVRQTIQQGMICTWAFRLGLYLFTRIMKEGRDRRMDNVRNNPGKLFIFWTLQAVWVFVTLLPTLLMNQDSHDAPLGIRDYLGWTMWVSGFLVEVVADYQKAVFRNDPQNKEDFITTGLWSLSRHPNYFGEILLWFGLYISASSVLRGAEVFTVLCPVFNYILITKMSGIPPLEREGLKRWGHTAAYKKYLHDTPILVPFIW